MNRRKATALVLLSGVVVQIGGCAIDLAYYALDALVSLLPTLIVNAARSSGA